MKKYLLIVTALLCSAVTMFAQAPNTWTKKSDFGGGVRTEATGFAIGSKIYLGLGNNNGAYLKDFWEYDPATDKWTRKADFGGDARDEAVGFSINGKGYIGIGRYTNTYPYSYFKDFWEYDPATDKWTQKADFGGTARGFSTGFVIGNKGYIGAGYRYDQGTFSDVWEYDPATDKWTRKADFGGGGRSNPTSFSIGNKGYMGVGYSGGWNRDFWEYDPAADKWTRIANFGGSAREWVSSFSIGNKGYVGLGYPGFLKDFWEYDPATDKWTRKADFGGAGRGQAVGVSVGNKGYFGTGWPGNYKDFWEYTPDANICTPPSDLKVISTTDSTAKLGWTLPGSSIVGLIIHYHPVGNPVWKERLVQPYKSSVTINKLLPGTTYKWKIESVCAHKISPWAKGPDFTTTSAFASTNISDALIAGKFSASISPNPVTGNVLNLHVTTATVANCQLSITDMQGRMLIDQNLLLNGSSNKTIDVSVLRNGIYILKVINNKNEQQQIKFVKAN